MFGYDRPNLKELLTYPFLVVLFSAILAGSVPAGEWRDLAKFGYVAICINCAFVPACHLMKQFQDQIKNDEPDAPKKVEVEKLNIPNLNLFSQVSTGVRFDVRRNLARALLGEWEHHGAIDATESAWLKPRINSQDPRRKLPKRWQGKDAEFRLCKQDWEQAGILGRENPENNKSPFIVRDVEKLRTIVTGR